MHAVADPTEDDRATPDATSEDRRRPGRVDYHNSHMIPLLRGEPPNSDTATAEADAAPKVWWTDDLATARGIVIGVAIGTAVWVGIGVIWYFV